MYNISIFLHAFLSQIYRRLRSTLAMYNRCSIRNITFKSFAPLVSLRSKQHLGTPVPFSIVTNHLTSKVPNSTEQYMDFYVAIYSRRRSSPFILKLHSLPLLRPTGWSLPVRLPRLANVSRWVKPPLISSLTVGRTSSNPESDTSCNKTHARSLGISRWPSLFPPHQRKVPRSPANGAMGSFRRQTI